MVSVWTRLANWGNRLLPDYGSGAKQYWWTYVWCAAAVIAFSVAALILEGENHGWIFAVIATVLCVVASFFPLRVPGTTSHYSLGDAFNFCALIFGSVPAACIASAVDGYVTASRSSKRWSSRLGTPALAVVTMFVVGHAFEPTFSRFRSTLTAASAPHLLLASVLLGLSFGTALTFLASRNRRLKQGEPFVWRSFVRNYGWIIGAYAISSSAAGILFVVAQLLGAALTLVALPVFALLLVTLHFFAKQQDAAAKAAEHKAEVTTLQAQQREADMAAQHIRELDASEKRFHRAFTHASIGMALIDADGNIQLSNPALERLLDASEAQLRARAFADFVSDTDRSRFEHSLIRVRGLAAVDIDDGPTQESFEGRCLRSDGEELVVSIAGGRFSDDAGAESLILQVQDVTARRAAEAQLAYRAFHDKLTGLPNRDKLLLAIDALMLQRAGLQTAPGFAVLSLDFDRFKLINDSNGHAVGDEFLVKAAERLQRVLRKGDVLARLGGDEFAILAREVRMESEATDMASRLLDVLQEPLSLKSLNIAATASIGITFSSMGYTRADDMLRDADIAMYRAKQNGKACYALFDVVLRHEVTLRVQLEADLRRALDQGAMSVAFQPLHDLSSGELVGFEALSRWTHPELGFVNPSVFIPIAEDSGLIPRITSSVLEASCRYLRGWQMTHPDCENLQVHINVAGQDLTQNDFVGRVQAALVRYELKPRHLVVELTENILMSQLQASLRTLHALRALGVGLAVDDFGTGYSSLSHLSTLPIDSLKIDMSFVRPLTDQQCKEAAVIRSIVLLGTSLGKTIVAEGVETLAQYTLLRDLGCHIGQGYYMSKPLDPEAVDAMLQGRAAVRHVTTELAQSTANGFQGDERPVLMLAGGVTHH